MKLLSNLLPAIGIFSSVLGVTPAHAAKTDCLDTWKCKIKSFNIPYSEFSVHETAHVDLRVGYRPEQTGVPFAGNILYLEGLGDSMMNHEPLFAKLGEAGYRVISFDYMGQGGSDGKMDHTRIARIGEIGMLVLKKFARLPEPSGKTTVIGWSTGGLAAYLMALKHTAQRVVLIAPGIAPNVIVGAGLMHWPPDEITLPSLTAADYTDGQSNPHVDPIRPTSPAEVPSFALNLIATGAWSRDHSRKVSADVEGLVLLSGVADTYVDTELTNKTLTFTAPHFTRIQYQLALHEIDNESEITQLKVQNDILKFLKN